MKLSRKTFNKRLVETTLATASLTAIDHQLLAHEKYKFNYILCSAMYGTMKLEEVLPEVHKTGSNGIDLWPLVHANHREQAEKMGKEAFKALLLKNKVKVTGMACYKLGPFGLQNEMKYAREISGPGTTFVCASRGPKKLKPGKELKNAVRDFCEKLKPHVEVAEELGMKIAIENHSGSMIHTKESILWFHEMSDYSDSLGIAYAPHHLEKANLNANEMGQLIIDLDSTVKYFYAQQYGKGSSTKMPKQDELLQMPGRGALDFEPLVAGLKDIHYSGPVGIFIHPYPRGLPILETVSEITAEINRSKKYLDQCIEKVS